MLTRIILGKKMSEQHQAVIREWGRTRIPNLRVESAADMILL